uniref:Phospholipid-transporting ATPase n=1 Tax=Scleropages formosus TaxID=113540 RepID=A0A8C9WC33_SCLFO
NSKCYYSIDNRESEREDEERDSVCVCVCVGIKNIKETLFAFPTNAIKTSKYNMFSFLPLNLFEQFQRIANAYFLFLLILQVMGLTHVSFSHLACRAFVNNKLIFSFNRLRTEKWMDVQVGDIIKLENNHFVTADLLLLSSSEPLNLVYIETAELDGSVAVCFLRPDRLSKRVCCFSKGELRCEPPNNRLDRFTGTLMFQGQKFSLDNEKVLLRGCTLRNTEWCFGLVIFAGPETKLMQNSGRTTFKRTSIDRMMNALVLCIFVFLVFMCTVLAIGNSIWEQQQGDFTTFLPRQDGVNAAFSGFLTFWSYVIILNTVVPISLYVSVEIIRLGNSFYIDWDRKMYYARSDTPAVARTTTLNEELGQIKYIFSDKTGTLTQNIMTFNKCSINGKCYGTVRGKKQHETEKVDFSYNPLADPKFSFHDHSLVEAVKLENPEVHAFFRLLALCHTAMAEEKTEGELLYQAQSPDEGALVTAARNFGFVFRSRTPETISIVEMGIQRNYELLTILDFNNVRKRMSVIVRSPEGKLSLYCKGADTVVYERLHPSCSKLMEVTTEHLSEFAGDGLRTLALAYKDLDESYFESWRQRHHEASTALDDREDKLDELYEEIEKNMLLLGATGIEDKLQDGVSHTIEQLSRADIKIWVLTGDKQGETPREILGKKSKLVQDEAVNGEYGLVINGHSLVRNKMFRSNVPKSFLYSTGAPSFLAYALDKTMELELLRTACMCKTVICCRVTPLQKAQVVELVKKYKRAVTLAIGDGANDVSMIKAAHIGVGISGQEGMQAVLSSDYSFAQFRYLQRLLLVHGRWSYLRMCKFLCYFFYKNFTFTFVHFWYAFFCGFSAQTVYDEWFITLYNLVYTALPVLGMSLFDQDVNDRWSFQYPQLYVPGQLNMYFSKTIFAKCVLHSGYSSLVVFFIPYAAMYNTVRDNGKDVADYQSFALLAQTCLLIAVCIQLGLDMAYWTAVNQFFVWGSLAVYFAITFAIYSNGIFLIFTSSFPFIGVARNTLNQANVWLTILLTTILCVLPVVAYRFLLMQLRPTINDKVFKVRQTKASPPPPPRRARIRRTSSRRSGYAFSHAQGYGDLVTSRRFLRRAPVSRSTAFSPTARSPGKFLPTGRSAGYSPTGRQSNLRQDETSLQMYRAVKDPQI